MSITINDLIEIQSIATREFVALPVRARLEGAERDLLPVEQHTLAIYLATVMVLRSKGALTDEVLNHLPKFKS